VFGFDSLGSIEKNPEKSGSRNMTSNPAKAVPDKNSVKNYLLHEIIVRCWSGSRWLLA
jgi:hypothetical protein